MELDVIIYVSVKLEGSLDLRTENDVYIEHLDQTICVAVPNNITKETSMRLKGLGKIGPNGEKGDLYLKFANIRYVDKTIDTCQCTICGQRLQGNVKFCSNCGTPVGNDGNGNQRKQEWAGKIVKCPNCGEVLDAFVVKCSVCGYEVRGAQASSSAREFAYKLELLEKERPIKKGSIKDVLVRQADFNAVDQQKISLIRSYVIPNTVEDILEFMILASSNINLQRYNDFDSISESEKAVSDAWEAKFEQAYEKAKLSFGDIFDFQKIDKIYKKKNSEINKWKRKRIFFWIGVACFLALALVLSIFDISFAQ